MKVYFLLKIIDMHDWYLDYSLAIMGTCNIKCNGCKAFSVSKDTLSIKITLGWMQATIDNWHAWLIFGLFISDILLVPIREMIVLFQYIHITNF